MRTIMRREIPQRGLFGWIFVTAFILFNLAMLAWLIHSIFQIPPIDPNAPQFLRATLGSAIMIVFSQILSIWCNGATILGILVYFTRGNDVIVQEVER